MTDKLGRDIEQIALNAIRYRSERRPEDDSERMAKDDRRWLLRYIERYASSTMTKAGERGDREERAAP